MREKRGFTLLELLMVVIIIAILASIALPQYIKASEKARASEALSALGAIRASEFRYKALHPNNEYANNAADLDFEIANSANPLGNLTSWNTLTFENSVNAGLVATGNATYMRISGQFTGQELGIQFGSGTLCGNFFPIFQTPVICTED